MELIEAVPDEDPYADDEGHPIPRVGVIDVETTLEGGGGYYGLVVASPLAGDQRSQKRLLQKIQNYIDDFHSPQSLASIGAVNPIKCQIHVRINADSDPLIFDLLEKCRPWIEESNIKYVLKICQSVVE